MAAAGISDVEMPERRRPGDTVQRWTIETDTGYTKGFLQEQVRHPPQGSHRLQHLRRGGLPRPDWCSPHPPSVADAIRVSELDYGEDLPMGARAAEALCSQPPQPYTPSTVAASLLLPTP